MVMPLLICSQVEMSMRTLTNTDVKVKSYKIHLMEMVINAIYYNPVRFAQFLVIVNKRTNADPVEFDTSYFRVQRLDQ